MFGEKLKTFSFKIRDTIIFAKFTIFSLIFRKILKPSLASGGWPQTQYQASWKPFAPKTPKNPGHANGSNVNFMLIDMITEIMLEISFYAFNKL